MAMGTVVIAVGQRAPEECLETTRVNVLDNFASDVMWRQCSVNVRVNPESRHQLGEASGAVADTVGHGENRAPRTVTLTTVTAGS